MATSDKYIPFVGLTYGGVHSSDLGLYRVSDGSRYNDNLLPSFSDKTVERPGADGMYYFGADHTQKEWSIEFAFDHVTKEQLQKIKRLFGEGSKKPLRLVFDEDRDYNNIAESDSVKILHNHNLGEIDLDNSIIDIPPENKYYMAKVAQPPQLKTLCFEEEQKDGTIIDIYKGELIVDFISYTPYGYGKLKYTKFILEKDKDININVGEINKGDLEVNPLIILYNSSKFSDNIEAEFTVLCGGSTISGSTDEGTLADVEYSARGFSILVTIPKDTYGIVINCEKGIVNGLISDVIFPLATEDNILYESMDDINYVKNNIIYNSGILGGYFFEIPNELEESYIFKSSIDNINGILSVREKLY